MQIGNIKAMDDIGVVMTLFGDVVTVILVINTKGAIIFYREGGPSVCDGRSPIFSGPPLCIRKKILVPPLPTAKNFGPPL